MYLSLLPDRTSVHHANGSACRLTHTLTGRAERDMYIHIGYALFKPLPALTQLFDLKPNADWLARGDEGNGLRSFGSGDVGPPR